MRNSVATRELTGELPGLGQSLLNLKLIMILFYAHWEIKGGLYQNLPINATEIPQLAYSGSKNLITIWIVRLMRVKIRACRI
jgi:hypothetical protein